MNKVTKFFTTLTFSGLIFSLLVLPGLAASFEFSPASGNLVNGCTYNLVVYADVTGQSSNAADLIVNYNPAQLEVLDSIGDQAGVQVQPGSAYQAYVGNIVDQSGGKITVTAFSVGANLTSRKPFITIKAKPLTTGIINLQIFFTQPGYTLDSNIADSSSSLDILTSVVNASFTVVNGVCVQDTTPPLVQFISPTLNQTGFSGNTITLRISDAGSGVQLSSVQIVINGVSYNVNSPEVSYQPSGDGYIFTITLPESISSDQPGMIMVSASDNNGNSVTSQNTFNKEGLFPPEECEIPDNFLNTGNPADILKGTFLENTPIYDLINDANESFGSATTSALLAAILNILLSLMYLSWLTSPALLLNAILVLLGLRRERKWGVVYDDVHKSPVALAVCRLYLKDTKSLVAQTLTDDQGRYGFTAPTGEYRLEIQKDGYLMFSRNLTVGSDPDALYVKVYLKPSNFVASDVSFLRRLFANVWKSFKRFLRSVQNAALYLGLFLSALGVVLRPGAVNLIILIVYALIAFIILRRRLKAKAIGSAVVDIKNKYKLTNFRIQVYDLQTKEIVDVIAVGTSGSFDYLGKEGEFGLALQAPGYRFSEQGQELQQLGKLKLLRAKLKTGGNQLKLWAEEFAENRLSSNNSNYLNPFAD